MRRFLLGACSLAAFGVAIFTAPGCGSSEESTFDAGSSSGGDAACVGLVCPVDGGPKPGCVGLECKQLPCENGGKTTVSGTVFDPAGKVPVYNATVYIPNTPLADIPAGATGCDRCDAKVSGTPIAITATDTSGRFTLENVPVDANVPLVIQIGKWRRKIEIPNVGKCADTALDATLTRLPKNRTEGNIPRIALTTGGADPLQCLLRKIGIDDSEFGVAGSDSRIHLYAGGGYNDGTGAHPASKKFGATLNGGAAFGSAETFWSSVSNLKKYDVVLLSCEGGENETAAGAAKPASAKQALYDYAKEGGRLFASHYHEVWLRKSPETLVSSIATWADPEKPPPAVFVPPQKPADVAVISDISTSFPKAVAMKEWLANQSALSGGKLPIFDARHNVDAVGANGLNWISAINPNAANSPAVQYMTFNTPVGATADAVCGRVVFSNLHVGAGVQGTPPVADDPEGDFPASCKTVDLSAQQKALEFMLFDLSSCIQKDDTAVTPPR